MRKGVVLGISIALVGVLSAYALLRPASVPEDTSGVVRVDGGLEPEFGTYHESVSENGLGTYVSSTLGVALDYPTDYLLYTRSSGTGADAFETISIMPATSTNEAIAEIRAGLHRGGPASIAIEFFSKPSAESFSLQDWLLAHRAETNFDPANILPGTLATTTINGFPGYAYQSLGMFTFHDYAFVTDDWIVVASAADDTWKDLPAILASMRFSKTSSAASALY